MGRALSGKVVIFQFFLLKKKIASMSHLSLTWPLKFRSSSKELTRTASAVSRQHKWASDVCNYDVTHAISKIRKRF